MPLTAKPSDAPRIRSAISFYRVTAYITGVLLLLLTLMMIFRYGIEADIELGGPHGLLALVPKELITGINLSIVILTVHGWFYVIYIIADFRLWSLLRWPFSRFLLIAAGGVVPFLSFFTEHYMTRRARNELAALEQPAPTDQEARH